jgi:hypothetical protein
MRTCKIIGHSTLAALAALATVATLALLALAPLPAAAGPRDDPDRDRDRDAEPGPDEAREPGGEDEPAPATAAGTAAGPEVAAVVAAAYRAAGLHRTPGRSWSRRARLAGLVPWVTVRMGRNTSWQDLDPEVDRGMTVDVRATWRLDRLVFDGRELQAASIEAARRRERRQLASGVVRAYFRWQRLASAAAGQPRLASRAAEAAAELDALTDGWFSEQLDTTDATDATAAARRRTPARRR